MLELELPYPPSVNHYWRRVGTRTLISRGGRAFREAVCALLAAQRIRPLAGSLGMEVVISPPDNRRRDIDNCLKSLLDALGTAGAYLDDSQIALLTVTKDHPHPNGRVIVRIWQIAGSADCVDGGETPC